MKVLALTRYSRLGASSRMRIYQYLPVLHEFGINVQIFPLLRDNYINRLYSNQSTSWFEIFSDYLIQLTRLLWVNKYDLLWIEKEIFPNLPAWLEQLLNLLGIRYVVDYDDAIFHKYDYAQFSLKRRLCNKVDKVMRNAAMVTCGNSYLGERALSAGARSVEVIPTVIDLDRYSVIGLREKDRLVIGWIGSPSTVKYLKIVVPALRELAKDFPIELRVIGARFASPDLVIDCRPWSEESEVRDVQEFDIGIMPLIDSPWERGKCGYKLIQFMACGLPVVASPVGVNKEIVEHGANGYLAHTPEDWLNSLQKLCIDAVSRRTMGAQGRLAVENKYCLQVTGPHLARLFQHVVEKT